MIRRLLLIGLVVATFKLINLFLEKGWMAKLKELNENVACGSMQSIFPLVTGPAWLAI